MGKFETLIKKSGNRRTFLKTGMAAGAVTMGAGLMGLSAFGQDQEDDGDITKGDIAILRFLNALEQIEADLWIQYSELGGTQDNEVSGVNGGNPLYTAALTILDGDMAQYIHDNTDDEKSHAAFLKAYLESKGAEAVDLSPFATIPGSTATGSTGRHGSPTSRSSRSTPAFGPSTAASLTPISTLVRSSFKPFPVSMWGNIQRSREPTRTPPAAPSAVTLPPASRPICRQSPSRRGSTLHLLRRAEPASIRPSPRR